jgi:hypothetical protein
MFLVGLLVLGLSTFLQSSKTYHFNYGTLKKIQETFGLNDKIGVDFIYKLHTLFKIVYCLHIKFYNKLKLEMV